MVQINPEDKKYIITFKRKNLRLNQRDDKFEIFRSAIGLADIRDILDLSHYTHQHMHDEIIKTKETVTDINSYEIPVIMARLTADQANALRKNPNIEYVEEDVMRHADVESGGWQVEITKAYVAWNPPLSVRGEGVNVAVIDSGITPHVDFGSNVKVNQNFTDRPTASGEDPARHGTHVAGIIGAVEGNDVGIEGVAPSCNLWNLRVLNHQGGGTSSDIMEGLVYAAQNAAHVVNLSLGGGAFTQAEQNAYTSGYAEGILYVCSAGNTGTNVANYPASYAGTLGVSNLGKQGSLDPSSTFGTHVDFAAPGTAIISLAENNMYRELSGTSMAAPCVSGIAALMLSAYRDTGCPPYSPGAKKNDIIIAVMRDTATKTGLVGASPVGAKDIQYGWGLPQANNAVAALKGVLPAAISI